MRVILRVGLRVVEDPKQISNKEEDDESFWQSRIQITQTPQSFIPQVIPETAVPFYQRHEDIRSFLYDPFGDNPPGTYGLELTAKDNVEVVFFSKFDSQSDAIKSGYAWLSNLKYKFRGLDGTVKAKSIMKHDPETQNECHLSEIILPQGFIKKKINIIERFISAFYYTTEHTVQLFILWRREPRSEKSQEQSNLFNLRIFIEYHLKNSDIEEKLKLEGILQFLSMDIENQKGDRARIVNPSDISHLDLLKGDVFNDDNELLRNFVQEDVNFDFSESLPIPRLPILENENVRYIDIHDDFKRKAISVGNHIKDGVITDHETFIPINKLAQDLAIFGKSGSGKTYFLARFITELTSKAKNVGILVLNVAKESQEIFYQGFSNRLHIPPGY